MQLLEQPYICLFKSISSKIDLWLQNGNIRQSPTTLTWFQHVCLFFRKLRLFVDPTTNFIAPVTGSDLPWGRAGRRGDAVVASSNPRHPSKATYGRRVLVGTYSQRLPPGDSHITLSAPPGCVNVFPHDKKR